MRFVVGLVVALIVGGAVGFAMFAVGDPPDWFVWAVSGTLGILIAMVPSFRAKRTERKDPPERSHAEHRPMRRGDGHPSEKDISTASLPKLPSGPGPGSDVGRTS